MPGRETSSTLERDSSAASLMPLGLRMEVRKRMCGWEKPRLGLDSGPRALLRGYVFKGHYV